MIVELNNPIHARLFPSPITVQGLSSLRDSNPCTSSFPLFKMFWWTLLEGDYEKAAKVVSNRINWNRGLESGNFECFYGFNPQIGVVLDSNCSNISQVSCIMNAYYNAVMSNNLPEFDPNNIYKTTKTKQKIEAETEQIIKKVESLTGQAYFRVKEVLFHLYWATYPTDNADRLSYQYISPLQYKNNAENISKPKDIGSGVTAAGEGVTSILGDAFSWIKWIAILGAVGLGAYLLVPIISTSRR